MCPYNGIAKNRRNTLFEIFPSFPLRPHRIHAHDRVIATIGVEVEAADGIGVEVGNIVNGDKAADLGIVISCQQIIQPGFGIVVIPTIAEGVKRTEVAIGVVLNRVIAPRIVGVFYSTSS